MNATSPYWSAPQITTTAFKPVTHTPGFNYVLPWPSVTTAGWYYGSGATPDRRELIYRSDPEYFPRGGVVPSSGGVPSINPYNKIYKFWGMTSSATGGAVKRVTDPGAEELAVSIPLIPVFGEKYLLYFIS